MQVALEVLEKSHFFLKCIRELIELVLRQHVLLLARANRLALIVEEARTLIFGNNFCRIIEEDPSRVVRQQVAEPVLCRIVYPLGNPDGRSGGLS